MRIVPRLFASTLLFALASNAASAQQTAVRSEKAAASAATAKPNIFVVDPYVQLGDTPARSTSETLQVLWHADDFETPWSLDYRSGDNAAWQRASAPVMRRIAVGEIAPHRVYRTTLAGLRGGETVEYRVHKSGAPVFTARAQAPKGVEQPHRFVVFGDCGANTAGQKAVAYQTYRAQPDFVMIAGDIVYSRGRISEYREKYWPIYNADAAAPEVGAPLLRSTLFIAAPGNHDILNPDLKAFPDALAYFYYWSQPLNGPSLQTGDPNTPKLSGPEPNQKAFLDAADAAFPRMANFSFDYGNAHWTVLDSNPYTDWTSPELRQWVERDLAAASGATWRFVAFHHPGFNSSKKHFSEQRMRRMAATFEQGGVDVVFTGHVHNYQRTYPLHYVADPAKVSTKRTSAGANDHVEGHWTLDKSFDGTTRTRPDGVIYLVTGAGGASLYDPEQTDEPASWQEFTHKFLAKTHSLTIAEVNGRTLSVRQVSGAGEELDRFLVTK